MFTVIAERINMTRSQIKEEVWNRNADYIREQVRIQEEAGATHIDVNAGGDPSKEVEDMKWLTEVVAGATPLPISFDSSSSDALQAGLELCNRQGTIINSITGEKERIKGILPLVKSFNTSVICLTMDDGGMPEDLEGRLRLTRDLAEQLKKDGIGLDRVYFDHLVRPASTNPGQAQHILEAVRTTKEEFPEAHIAMGLSNISFGIPNRNNLNKVFFSMLLAAGADGAIIDPCEEGMMAVLLSGQAVLGQDEYCMNYITAHREGKL